ncbi:hypothetical protein PM082_003545 [Marasmius tenuissimus]|nr:hypothetical protein PM082_003545 [Marasmius tenuissimus]
MSWNTPVYVTAFSSVVVNSNADNAERNIVECGIEIGARSDGRNNPSPRDGPSNDFVSSLASLSGPAIEHGEIHEYRSEVVLFSSLPRSTMI